MITKSPEEYEAFKAFLLIGTNVGQRDKNLELASSLIQQNECEISIKSSIYESAAWGVENQNSFFNQVLKIETHLGPWELLETVLSIEKKMGRIRSEKWTERIIDIDILYFDELIANSFDLVIPHPGIPDRKFTLVPLVEIASDKLHPKLHLTQSQLLEQCKDDLWVKKIA